MKEINNPFLITEAAETIEAMKTIEAREIISPTKPVFSVLKHIKKATKNMNLNTYKSKFFRSKRILTLNATAIYPISILMGMGLILK